MRWKPIMTIVELGDGCSITVVGDNENKKSRDIGNFLGVYFIPPQGGFEWWAQNGDCGTCATELEARTEIQNAWRR
jgi:hypothetical protein